MKKIFNLIEEQNFTVREYCFCGITLFALGVLLGIVFSPKGERMYGCNNGNNNGNNNSGCLTEDCSGECTEDC